VKRRNSRGLAQRKRSYIFWGAFIGFAVWVLPVLLLSILSIESLVLGSIVVFSIAFSAALLSLSSFIAATALLGGLIGYWVWKAKMRLEKSPKGQRVRIETALWKAKEELEKPSKAARK